MGPTPDHPVMVLFEATEELIAASEQAVLGRIDLARSETTEDLHMLTGAIAWMTVALALAALGWVLVVAGTVVTLSQFIDPGLAAVSLGLPHVACGLVLAWLTSHHANQQEIERYCRPIGAGATGAASTGAASFDTDPTDMDTEPTDA